VKALKSPISAIKPTAVSVIADLGDQADRGQRVDASQAPQPRDHRRPGPGGGLLGDQPVEALAACQQHLVAGQVLRQDDLRERVLQADGAQPREVALGRPGRSRTREQQAAAQQQLADPVPGAHQIATQVLPGADQVTQRLEF
jgi:hypothetical protein